MSRSYARECTFKLVFSYLFSKEKDFSALEEFLNEPKLKDEKGYLSEVYNGIINNYSQLSSEISKLSEGFKVDRIYKIDMAILLVAVYEMKYIDSIPPKVSINEALNLAKIYSTDQSSSYINGILKNFVGE